MFFAGFALFGANRGFWGGVATRNLERNFPLLERKFPLPSANSKSGFWALFARFAKTETARCVGRYSSLNTMSTYEALLKGGRLIASVG